METTGDSAIAREPNGIKKKKALFVSPNVSQKRKILQHTRQVFAADIRAY